MKKKFYDFSVSTAVIVILAYIFVLILSIYTILDSDEVSVGGIIFTVLLVLSLIALIIRFGFLPIVLTESKIKHRKIAIDKCNALWTIRRNYRYRYDELVFRDKSINYENLSKKEIRKTEIVVQYFPKYELFLEKYLGPNQESCGE